MSENTNQKLDELHNMAKTLVVSSQDHSLRKMAAMMSGGYDFSDTLHNIYADYGYPEQLEFSNFWNMYRRFGIAKNVVDLPVETGWKSAPTIEASEKFLSEFEALNKRIKVWVRLKGLDTRQRVGRYAGMFMRIRDGKRPEEPIDGTIRGVAAIYEMMPLYESQLEVIETDSNPTSENFGQPIILQYKQSAIGGRNEKANQSINIHASRIVFASEGADNGWIYGVSALEAPYNSLMDLRKIIGGGAEGFYKNAAQSIVFDVKDPENASVYEKQLKEFTEKYDDFSRNRARRSIMSPGMDPKVLSSTMQTPQEFFTVAINDVAAAVGIPATILIGQQTGRLASSEDSKQFLSGIISRQENFMTEMTRNVFDWLITYGVLPKSDYEIIWDDLLASSDMEKLDNGAKMAEINEKQFRSGGDVPFSGEEIRNAAGYEDAEVIEQDGEYIEDIIEDIT